MNKNILVIAVLVVLVVISAVQAVQLSSLKEKLSTGKLSPGSSSKSVTVGQGNQPTSLQNLPSMVGGC